MSLPSQSSRSARSSAVHYRRSQGSPLRRLLPAILVVAALALILWFALIRPSKTQEVAGDTPQGNPQASTQGSPDDLQNANSSDALVEITNASPSRALPGSGDSPNTAREAENTITNTDPITRNQTPESRPATTIPNRSSGNSLLESARNSGTGSTNNSTTRSGTNSNPQSTSRNNPQDNPQNNADRVQLQLDTARRMVSQNDRVAARRLLSQTLNNPNVSHRDAQLLRSELTAINDVLVFGPVVAPNDPMCEEYKIQSGDSLSRIARRRELATHWKLIQRVNRISNPSRIRLGQTIKLVRGPFHAIVHKSEHRMDVYHGAPNDPSNWVYIRSFNVGLGEDNGTPIGVFTISMNKLENPGWVNPRDASERYSPDDPRNPIGEYWLGFDGVGEYAPLTGYGIHGTIDPDSIGDNRSMGCVRLADDDIALVYELLGERVSVVEIRP